MTNINPKYSRYQDYIIRDGNLVGKFEQMYQDHKDPWEQTTREEQKVLGRVENWRSSLGLAYPHFHEDVSVSVPFV